VDICVCGWHYFDSVYDTLRSAHKKYPVFVVAHRDDELLHSSGLPFYMRENVGLEWGAYDWYIKNQWDGKSDVLFMHDDVRIRPVIKEYEVVDPVCVFNTVARLGDTYDQAYIFKSKHEYNKNFFIHGRALFCNAKTIRILLDRNDGFWYDADNTGHTGGSTPDGCKHYNEADYRFWRFLSGLHGRGDETYPWEAEGLVTKEGLMVNQAIIIPAFDCARRGRFEEERSPI